jgi:predicted RNase H-like nuclease (RuvC/YqgF family)
MLANATATPAPTVESLTAENRTLRHDLKNAEFAAQLLEDRAKRLKVALAAEKQKTAERDSGLFAAQQALLTEGMRADRLQAELAAQRGRSRRVGCPTSRAGRTHSA